jgi:hypothetical protein
MLWKSSISARLLCCFWGWHSSTLTTSRTIRASISHSAMSARDCSSSFSSCLSSRSSAGHSSNSRVRRKSGNRRARTLRVSQSHSSGKGLGSSSILCSLGSGENWALEKIQTMRATNTRKETVRIPRITSGERKSGAFTLRHSTSSRNSNTTAVRLQRRPTPSKRLQTT